MRIPFVGGLTARVIDYWIRARSSYWFLPSLMTVGAIFLAVGLVAVDRAEAEWVSGLWFVVASQPDGARELLATVAGSMITVAGVTFSMTLLMASFASAQLGPRLVPRFLRDRGNQVVLGMFIATFIYCLLVLRTVRSADETASSASGDPAIFVPHLAILVGVLLALLSVAVLIYFLHHVPMRINAGSVISLLGDELLLRLEREFPRADEGGAGLRWPDELGEGHEIRLESTGCYLRIVDYGGLVEFAKRTDRKLTTLVAPGAFCVPDAPIVRVHGGRLSEACVQDLRGLFSWGGDRTPDQDILLLVEQLAEVAGKALSTGVNDQFTALLSIDQMERVLCAAAKRREPDRVLGADGVPWVLITHVSLPEVADRFLMPLRQFARGDLLTTDRLLAMLASCLAHHPDGSPLHDNLRRHRDALFADAAVALPAASERDWLAERETERRTTKLSNADPSGVHARPDSRGSGLQK